MVWHQQPRLRTREAAFEGIGLLPAIDSQGVVVLEAAEAAGKRPPQPVDIVTYWIGDLKIQVSGDIAMIDFVPTTTLINGLTSITMRRCTYFRIGDWLQIQGSFDYVPSDSFADMYFSLAPPIAHTFSVAADDMVPFKRDSSPAIRFQVSLNEELAGTLSRVLLYMTSEGANVPGTCSFLFWARIPE